MDLFYCGEREKDIQSLDPSHPLGRSRKKYKITPSRDRAMADIGTIWLIFSLKLSPGIVVVYYEYI